MFADVGCDHGYIAKAMLKGGKAQKVIVSDVSKKCLEKAEQLLAVEISQGLAESVVSDGFDKVGECDLALIAGMGGEEIVAILNNAKRLPDNLVLQPMKNCDKVRRTVLALGYRFNKDFLFKAGGKFYDLIVLEKGVDNLNEEQIEFGKDNLIGKNKDFSEMIWLTLEKYERYLLEMPNGKRKEELEEKINRLKKYV